MEWYGRIQLYVNKVYESTPLHSFSIQTSPKSKIEEKYKCCSQALSFHTSTISNIYVYIYIYIYISGMICDAALFQI